MNEYKSKMEKSDLSLSFFVLSVVLSTSTRYIKIKWIEYFIISVALALLIVGIYLMFKHRKLKKECSRKNADQKKNS